MGFRWKVQERARRSSSVCVISKIVLRMSESSQRKLLFLKVAAKNTSIHLDYLALGTTLSAVELMRNSAFSQFFLAQESFTAKMSALLAALRLCADFPAC